MFPYHFILNNLPIRHSPRKLHIMSNLLKAMLLSSIVPYPQRILKYMPHTDERTAKTIEGRIYIPPLCCLIEIMSFYLYSQERVG